MTTSLSKEPLTLGNHPLLGKITNPPLSRRGAALVERIIRQCEEAQTPEELEAANKELDLYLGRKASRVAVKDKLGEYITSKVIGEITDCEPSKETKAPSLIHEIENCPW